MEWQTIETAPKDGSEFLAYGVNADYEILRWTSEGWADDGGPFRFNYFTHWMPLPPPPVNT